MRNTTTRQAFKSVSSGLHALQQMLIPGQVKLAEDNDRGVATGGVWGAAPPWPQRLSAIS